MDTLVPRANILLSGRTLEDWGLRSFLRSVTCSRSADRTATTRRDVKGRSRRDTATLVFDDADHQVVRHIAMRERVDIMLGYDELWHRGSYMTYAPSPEYAEDQSISIECQDMSMKLMENQGAANRRWSGASTLGQIVRKVVNTLAYGMDADVHPDLEGLTFHGISSERHESDWDFLERLVRMTGIGQMFVRPGWAAGSATAQDTLVVRPFGHQIDKLPIPDAPRPAVLGYRDPSVDVPIGSAKVRLDVEKGLAAVGADLDATTGKFLVFRGDTGKATTAIQVGSAGGGVASTGRTLLGSDVAGEAGMLYPPGLTFLRDFETSLRLWQAFAVRLDLDLPVAAPFLYPSQKVRITGVGPFSGDAVITSIRDTYGDGGYGQTLEAVSAAAMDATDDATVGFKVLVLRGDTPGSSTAVQVAVAGEAAVEAEASGDGP